MAKHSQKSRRERPSEIVSRELGARDQPGSIEQHLAGCMVGYNQDPNFGSAVHFGLEAIWGIGRYYRHLAAQGKIAEGECDPEFGLKPTHMIGVPWMWVLALTEAWDQYDKQGKPFERAFGLAGAQGKRPTRSKINRMIDQRAVAVDVWDRVQKARSAGRELLLIDALHAAAEKFAMSFDTVEQIWKRHGGAVKQRRPRG